jgi:hypothetical protein
MRGSDTATATFKKRATALRTAPLPMVPAGRLLGLNAGDWSMVLFGLILSGLLLALI